MPERWRGEPEGQNGIAAGTVVFVRKAPGRWGGRRPTASQCDRMRSLRSQARETVRGEDYSHWAGYVKERFPIARGERGGRGGSAEEAAARTGACLLRRPFAAEGGHGSLRRGASLGARAAGAGP